MKIACKTFPFERSIPYPQFINFNSISMFSGCQEIQSGFVDTQSLQFFVLLFYYYFILCWTRSPKIDLTELCLYKVCMLVGYEVDLRVGSVKSTHKGTYRLKWHYIQYLGCLKISVLQGCPWMKYSTLCNAKQRCLPQSSCCNR